MSAGDTRNPEADAEREKAVLMPRRFPSVSIRGEPAVMESCDMPVSMTLGASSFPGRSAVMMPAAIREIVFPERAMTLSPRTGLATEIAMGFHEGTLPSTVEVAGVRYAIPA